MAKSRLTPNQDFMKKKVSGHRTVKGRSGDRVYKCVFFDLDHTLWDYACNARETLLELHTAHHLADRGIAFELFNEHFHRINFELWAQYDRGEIDKSVIRDQRFTKVLAAFNVQDKQLSELLSSEYLHGCPKKSNLMPYAKEILAYLSKQYALTLVTNGFEEIQTVKLSSGDITHYFDHVITSQNAGFKKPAREIFDYALAINKLQSHEAIMIGDNLITDIGGARNASIATVFYNPDATPHNEQVDHEIRCLSELQHIL